MLSQSVMWLVRYIPSSTRTSLLNSTRRFSLPGSSYGALIASIACSSFSPSVVTATSWSFTYSAVPGTISLLEACKIASAIAFSSSV